MTRYIIIGLIILVVIAVVFLAYTKYRLDNTADSGDLEAILRKEADDLFKRDLSRNLVIGIYKDGETHIAAYSKNVDQPRIDQDSLYEIGSLTKVFTASLLGILADEGVVQLDDTLGQLIGERFELAPHIQSITLQQLATHTSGLPRVPKMMLNRLENPLDPYSTFSVEDIADYLKEAKEFGTTGKFAYSNLGMGLLGHVLEWQTGQTLQALMDKKIFTPLNMRSTGFDVPDDQLTRFIKAYDAKGNETPHWTFGILAGAGSLRSSALDMMAFIKANIELDGPLASELKRTHPAPQSKYMGLGWMGPTFLERWLGSKDLIWHNGLVGGHASYMSFDTTHKTGVLILSNKAMDLHIVGSKISRLARIHSFSAVVH